MKYENCFCRNTVNRKDDYAIMRMCMCMWLYKAPSKKPRHKKPKAQEKLVHSQSNPMERRGRWASQMTTPAPDSGRDRAGPERER